ncbi:MAG: winged helix-turn-helix domain-containing protein [Myxococcota bacterium]|nr:winged helix-turn-helix domain-containing protein [Myxococcota bacterium]
MRETITIVDPKAAAVFATPRQRKLLLSVVDEERSLSQLARLTETPLNLLHHHIRKFMRLGLVTIARETSRAGAPMKYYRATARAFFVPAELMDPELGAGLNSKLNDLLVRSRARALQGVVYSHDGSGPRMRLVRGTSSRSTATELWAELRLSDAAAASMADDLRRLLHRYEACASKTHRRHLIHAAVVRV